MLELRSLTLALITLTACGGGKPQTDARADAKEAEAKEATPEKAEEKTEAKAEAASVEAPPSTGSPTTDTPTGPDTMAAKVNLEGCTKPTDGKVAAYRLAAFGASAGAIVELRLDTKTTIMTGEGFRLDPNAGMVPETVKHQIDPAKAEPFTKKLDALCLNFAPVAPDAPAAPNGFTRYGVEFEDGSVRWMSDTNPGLGSAQIFGKVEREKWLDLNSSWPKYQDAKAL
jgi:hypothetical protein